LRSSVPLISSSPLSDTWRELVEQWMAGTHAAPEMITPLGLGAFAFDLVGLFVGEGPFGLGAVEAPLEGAVVPPTPPLAPVEALDMAGN